MNRASSYSALNRASSYSGLSALTDGASSLKANSTAATDLHVHVSQALDESTIMEELMNHNRQVSTVLYTCLAVCDYTYHI
jgi:hypothetical protein